MPGGFRFFTYVKGAKLILRNFRFNLLIRLLLLMGLCLLLAFLVMQTNFVVVPLLVGGSLIAAVIELLYYLERSNRDLRGFLASIQHDDFSTTFTTQRRGKSFDRLYGELNRITEQFQRIRAQKEAQYQYLQTIVAHVEVGLLAYSQRSGEVLLMNQTLQRMLRRPYLQHVNGLRHLGEPFARTLTELPTGERALIKLRRGSDLLQLAVRATEFKLEGEPYRLISCQNIRGELEARDLEAWQQLIRILTHEIMNSVTPVVSLSGTLREMFDDESALDDPENLLDARAGLSAIEARGRGLIRFTEAYRDLTRLPEPQFEAVVVDDLLGRIHTLYRQQLLAQGIELRIEAEELPPIQADPQLIEQVLINLIKNAAEALTSTPQPRVCLRAYAADGRSYLQVQDNGPGIPEEVLERIFVPFFTTKTNGSGIGLSLSRQIMQRHKGELSAFSEPEQGTTFTLAF
jgi:two-component system, NtrC family, nitrogen regulation sensor histidine kinase NtrY